MFIRNVLSIGHDVASLFIEVGLVHALKSAKKKQNKKADMINLEEHTLVLN